MQLPGGVAVGRLAMALHVGGGRTSASWLEPKASQSLIKHRGVRRSDGTVAVEPGVG